MIVGHRYETSVLGILEATPCSHYIVVFLFQCPTLVKTGNENPPYQPPPSRLSLVAMEPPTERPLAAFDATMTFGPEQKNWDFFFGEQLHVLQKKQKHLKQKQTEVHQGLPPKQKHQENKTPCPRLHHQSVVFLNPRPQGTPRSRRWWTALVNSCSVARHWALRHHPPHCWHHLHHPNHHQQQRLGFWESKWSSFRGMFCFILGDVCFFFF